MNDTIVNETANFTQDAAGSSANEIILGFFSSSSGIPLGESIIFWIIMGIFGFLIYTFMSMFTEYRKSVILICSASPLITFDTIESYGIYVFDLPFLGIYEVDRLVMTLGLIDWIFGFQIFNPALDIMSKYAVEEGDPLTTGLKLKVIWDLFLTSSWLPISVLIITGLISIGDSILQFIVFFMAGYYGISIIEDKRGKEFSSQIPISILIGALPVLFYAFYFSNPIHEFEKANIQIASLFHFISVAPLLDKAIVIILGLTAFIIVLTIMSIITKFFISSSKIVMPSMQQTEWMTDLTAVAFMTTIVYTFLYIMHPDYKWYLIIAVIVLWKAFRHVMTDIAHEAKGRTKEREGRKREIAMIVNEVQNPSYSERLLPKEQNSFLFDIEIIFAAIGFICIFFGFLFLTGRL